MKTDLDKSEETTKQSGYMDGPWPTHTNLSRIVYIIRDTAWSSTQVVKRSDC